MNNGRLPVFEDVHSQQPSINFYKSVKNSPSSTYLLFTMGDIEVLANSAEELEGEARELFAKYDLDRSGTLDLGQFTILLSNEIGIPPDDIADVFDEFDEDHNGTIDFVEFVKHHNLLVERQRKRFGTRGGNGPKKVSQTLKTGRTLSGLFPKGKRIAVIFACDDYVGSEHEGKSLANLDFAVKDAELFRDTIKAAGFEIFSYKVNGECTSESMRNVLDDVISHFEETSTIAQFIFYYAGHGVKDKNSKGWFALNKYNNKDRKTKFKMAELKSKASEIGAIQQLYVLDCCHAGELFGKTRGVKLTFGLELASKPCVFGITAVTGDQEAEEGDGHGLFTKTLCYGIGKKQAAMGDKPYATSNDLLEFVQIRVHEKSNNRMQPCGEKMLHDHFDNPCNGQFIMFHEETINNLKADYEQENEARTSTRKSRGVGAQKVIQELPSAADDSVQDFVNSIDGVKIKTNLTPIFSALNVFDVSDLTELKKIMVEQTLLPRLKRLEQKKWLQGDVIEKAKAFTKARLEAIESDASRARTIKEWLSVLPNSQTESVKQWLVNYGLEDFDDGLEDVVTMEQEDIIQLCYAMANCKAYPRRCLFKALKGLDSRLQPAVEEAKAAMKWAREEINKNHCGKVIPGTGNKYRPIDGTSEKGCQLIARLLGLKLGGNGTPFAGNFSNKGLYAYSSGPLKGCAFFGRGGSESDMLEKPLNKAIMHRPLDFTSEECSEKIANILGLKLGCVGGYAFAGNYKTKGLYTYRDGEAYFGREDDKK